MNITRAFADYRTSCYGEGPLPPDQERHVEQAFLSGVLAGMTVPTGQKRPVLAKLRERLMLLGCFPPGDHN